MDQRKKCGVEVDRISLLPDELVVHILSSLPSKTSASTSILSRRWLHLWKHTTKLIFRSDGSAKFVNRVNSVLKSHITPSLEEFTVDFFANKSHRHDLSKWLEFAFSRRVETLSLNVNGWRHTRFYDAPRFQGIIKLLLPTSIGMRSLKVLYLLQIKTNGASVRFFLENCPLLEELYIVRAAITSDLELVGPSLRYLQVEPHIRKKKFSIKVSAPNLTRLRVGLDTNRIVLENVPKLVDIVFRCYADATMHGFSAAASQLKTLSISIYIYYSDPKPLFLIPEMLKLKSLVIDNCYHYPPYAIVPLPVTSFLRASPCLQEFQVKFVRLALEEGETDQGCSVFRHSCLKRFKLLSCGRSSPHDNDCTKLDCIKLVKYVVESCVALEEIEVSQCEGTKWKEWDYIPVDDVCVRAATTAERTQLQLPAHIKLRIVNHSHKHVLEKY